jgi:hypothetical protein
LPRDGEEAEEEVEEWLVLVGTMEGEWIEKCEERLRSELRVAKRRKGMCEV